jgi:hypothetical protein
MLHATDKPWRIPRWQAWARPTRATAVLVGDHRVPASHAVVGGVFDLANGRNCTGDEVR